MTLIEVQNILDDLKHRENLQAIQIKTNFEDFNKRFSDVSSFFRTTKNSLHSINGLSNRIFFKGLSGVYFSECDGVSFEIIIIYDENISSLNRLQVIARIRKMLGYDIHIEFGSLEHFEVRIRQMVGIERKVQKFGRYYVSE